MTQIESQLIDRATRDHAFRAALTQNPRQTLQQMGVDLPADVEVKVLNDSPRTVHIVLPSTEMASEAVDLSTGAAPQLTSPNLTHAAFFCPTCC